MIGYNVMAFALECTAYFLGEYRTETYKWYFLGGTELKNVLGAKNGLQERALLVLERRAA